MPDCCFAWLLLPNRAHVLPFSATSKRLLTYFNVAVHCLWQVCSQVFQKVLFLCCNLQTTGGRDVSPVAWAAQGGEVPDPWLFSASHCLFPLCNHISVGNQTSLLIHSNTFPRRCYGWGAPQYSAGITLEMNLLLHCSVSAWGQFIRQSRSRCMLGEAGNSDDRQSLCHLPRLLANDVLFISRSATKTLTPTRNMFNDTFSSFEIYRLMDEEPKLCCWCAQWSAYKTLLHLNTHSYYWWKNVIWEYLLP